MASEFLAGNTTLFNQSATNTPTRQTTVGEQFLRFQLGRETTALLPVHQMTEVLNIPVNQIVPIPHLPGWVMGVYNWRGEILWVVDLGYLVGLNPLHQQEISHSTYTTIVIHSQHQNTSKKRLGGQVTGSKMLGLVVEKVEDMEWCNPDLIQSPPQSAITSEIVPFLRGYWMKSNNEMLLVLEGEAIIAGMPRPEV
jgi:positive phototaxis protein PixI